MRALIGVELLRKLPNGPLDIRDTKLTGFVLRIRPGATPTYYVNYGRGKWDRVGTITVLTAPEARDEARLRLADVARGEDPVEAKRAERRRMTLETFVDEHFAPWARVQRKTGEELVSRLRSVFASLLRTSLDSITTFDIERWRSTRLKTVTPATVNRDLNVLRGALSRAVEWKFLEKHPLATLKASRTDRGGVVRYLSADEERRLYAALEARDERRRAARDRANAWRRERAYALWPNYHTYTDHLTPLVTLALHTGLRRGELFQLRWCDVDLLGCRLTVRGAESKTGQTRSPLRTARRSKRSRPPGRRCSSTRRRRSLTSDSTTADTTSHRSS
jgi:integrase